MGKDKIIILVLLLICCTNSENKRLGALDSLLAVDAKNDQTLDSVLKSIKISKDSSQLGTVEMLLNSIILEKTAAIEKLDYINRHLDSVESELKTYIDKKKLSAILKQKLLKDIQGIKDQMNEIRPTNLKEVIQKPIPNGLKSMEEVPPGNYVTRLDSRHILRFYVNDDKELFVAPVILDSTMQFNGKALDPKVAEQIRKIKEKMNQ